MSYPFIDNFCGDPDELNVYESLIIHSNGQSKNGQYSIEAFSFNGNENGEIYLHCTVSIKKLNIYRTELAARSNHALN